MGNSTARIAKSQQQQRYYCTIDRYVAEEALEVVLQYRSSDSPPFATSWASTPPLRTGCGEMSPTVEAQALPHKRTMSVPAVDSLSHRHRLSASSVRVNPGAANGHRLGQYLRTSSAPVPTSTTCRFVPHSGHGVAVTRTRLDMGRGYAQLGRQSPHRCSSA